MCLGPKVEMKNNLNLQRQNNEENMNNINQPPIQDKPKDEIGNVFGFRPGLAVVVAI